MRFPALLLFGLLAPVAASASDFGYDYLDVGHLNVSPDSGAGQSGPFADLSYTILDGVQFRGRYEKLDYDGSASGSTAKNYDLGLTGETSLNAETDLYTDLLYLNDRVTDATGAGNTDDGYRIAIGLRHHAWQRVELDGYLAHNYLATGTNELGVGALITVTPWLSLGGSYARDSLHANTVALRVRFSF